MPWGFRNYVAFGHFSLNPRGFGQNLWWGSDPRIFAQYGTNRVLAVRLATAEMEAKGVHRPSGSDLFAIEHWEFQMGLENYQDLLHHPIALLRVLWMKTTRTLYASENRPTAQAALLAIQIPLILLASRGWRLLCRQPGTRQLAVLLAVYVGYFFIIVSAGMPMVRYFMPAIPLLIVSAVPGLSARWIQSGDCSRQGTGL